MEANLYIFILTAALILGIWWLWFFEYKKFFIDDTRQRLFVIRDELFKAAVNQEISFDDKLYKMTRTTLNGAIQYAHDLSTVKLLGSIVLSKMLGETPQLKKYRDSWANAFSDLDSETAKKVIVKAHKDMHLALFHHLVRSSIFLRLLIVPLTILLVLLKRNIDNTVTSSKARSEWLAIDAQTNSIGERLAA